jgi:nucleotide-binding universal stress UspA family protein
MLNHVMVPLDGSALSEDALHYARQIVSPSGRITLVTAIELPIVMPDTLYPIYNLSFDHTHVEDTTAYHPEKLINNANLYLRRIADRLLENEANGLDVIAHGEIGEPAEVIIKIARTMNVDAIVMSTHGRSGFTRWLFGSVTTKVLNAAPCPVLVIPSREIQAKIKTSTSEMYIG